ncbi:Histone-lysine N-methyltransferase [Emericellopsis cladophorae]|uniref:Histone-lysine N-methyltransferase, H3 lysine-36 specific n=1 Tax=Emericellopsis cladophorae TaxID=2686198 RepID=A0A9P9XVY3_9HYPO|nr:Histone-lysine N-methyltransferase [Emericellopsis cladophorae]KAI6778826.1 Histone-lysine N-methyltransferase [Emericellopsis cladophorae]
MEEEDRTASKMSGIKLEDGAVDGARLDGETMAILPKKEPKDVKSERSPPPLSMDVKSRSQSVETPTTLQKPKLSRKASQQPPRPPVLYTDLADATDESCETFQVIPDCLYGSKHLGSTDNDTFDCDCNQAWSQGKNDACGEDSDCINRATKMECSSTGNCGGGCQNQRFQRKEYAAVSVIKTEKKGFGLRTDAELEANDFIFEYIGEVINEPTFRRRMVQYDQEGIKHFYFMSLSKSEFVDATKKGNLGRFCNHSCNPNCYVDKWVVGDKLRMGIFALKRIQAGEELVFNYNVDRYGATPQVCYCGESNCIGFIGGKTQTERATKLPAATVEALGIDADDGWDTTVAKKPRKKRVEEDDEEYVSSLQPRSLTEEDATKVMATLRQCKEKWIAVKLMERIQRCEEDRVMNHITRLHGYQILKTVLNNFYDDANLVLQVLTIMDKFPRITRNKIQDSKIEAAIEPLVRSEHEDIAAKADKLMKEWSQLEMGYRIRRRQNDGNTPSVNAFDDRRGATAREEEKAPAPTPQPIDAPKGPRGNMAQRSNGHAFQAPRPRPRHFHSNRGVLPEGWSATEDKDGRTYFYDRQGVTTWVRPSKPSIQPVVNKAAQEQLAIADIIKKVTTESQASKQQAAAGTPKSAESSAKEPKDDHWRSLPLEKQQKLYERTIHPHVKFVVDKFGKKLPKEELKRLGKEASKKIIASDYKHSKVVDPTIPVTDKQRHKIKSFVKEYLDKAVFKAREQQCSGASGTPASIAAHNDSVEVDGSATPTDSPVLNVTDEVMSYQVNEQTPSDVDRKRKRDDAVADSPASQLIDSHDSKRAREAGGPQDATPPPPPPPPAGATGLQDDVSPEEQEVLRQQEEALMRENEEAQRMADEASTTEHLEHRADEMQREIDLVKGASNQEVMGH